MVIQGNDQQRLDDRPGVVLANDHDPARPERNEIGVRHW